MHWLGAAGAEVAYSSDTLKLAQMMDPRDKEKPLQQLAEMSDVVNLLDNLLVAQYPQVQEAVPSEDSEGTSQVALEACRLKLGVSTTSHVAATIAVSQGTLTCKLQLTVSSVSRVHADVRAPATQQQPAQPPVSPSTAKLLPFGEQPVPAFLSGLVWPTPKAASWNEIVVVACRAAMLLQFLQLSAEQLPQPATQDLRDALVRLLCQLLLGHLSDLRLHMQEVFYSAFVPVMQELEGNLHDEHGRTRLGMAFMRRLLTDAAVLNLENVFDPIVCPVYTKAVVIIWGFLGKWEQPT